MKTILIVIAILAVHIIMPSGVMAESDGFGNGVVSLVKKVGSFIDTMAIKGLDTRYIEAPQRPWQIILRGNINQSDLKLSATTAHAEDILFFMKDEMTWEPRIKTDPATYAGFWAGYRGYGFGYSWNVGGDKGRILTFGATGGSYGVNLRIHWFDNDEPEFFVKGTGLKDITDDDVQILLDGGFNNVVVHDDNYWFGPIPCLIASFSTSEEELCINRERVLGLLFPGKEYDNITIDEKKEMAYNLLIALRP